MDGDWTNDKYPRTGCSFSETDETSWTRWGSRLPQEAQAIRQASGEEFMIVTPGVRPAGAAINDQSRIATPMQALKTVHHISLLVDQLLQRSACGSLGNYSEMEMAR